jgi:hypothetical protein
MGYETRLYIVEKMNCTCFPEYNKKYARLIAMFDLSKFYALSDILRYKPKTDCYCYSDNGEAILEDCYREELTESNPEEIISILEKILDTGEEYRRIYPVLAMLKTMVEHRNQWSEIAVLHYGY